MDREWLDSRWKLFVDFCLPGMLAQKSKDFLWLLIFWEGTDPDLIARARALMGECPQIRIGLFARVSSWEVFAAQLASELKIEAGWLITTRVDSDDGLHEEALLSWRSACLRQIVADRGAFPLALNPVFGFQNSPVASYRVADLSCPFFSLIERIGNEARPVTALGYAHHTLKRHVRVKFVYSKAMWVQHVHGGNLLNHISGLARLSDTVPQGFTWKTNSLAGSNCRWVAMLKSVPTALSALVVALVKRLLPTDVGRSR